MPLPWVRLDTTFPTNPKLLAMLAERDGYRAAFVFVTSMSHCGAHGSDGFVTREALPHIHGRVTDACLLVKYGFWDEQPGGWLIHDWADFQESSEETRQRRKRAQAAAQSRWNGHQAKSDAVRAAEYRERKKARSP